MATSVLQDDEAAAMGDDGGDVGVHPSSPTAGTQSELNPKGQSDQGPSTTASTAAVSAATGEGDDATFGAAPPSSGAEMLLMAYVTSFEAPRPGVSRLVRLGHHTRTTG